MTEKSILYKFSMNNYHTFDRQLYLVLPNCSLEYIVHLHSLAELGNTSFKHSDPMVWPKTCLTIHCLVCDDYIGIKWYNLVINYLSSLENWPYKVYCMSSQLPTSSMLEETWMFPKDENIIYSYQLKMNNMYFIHSSVVVTSIFMDFGWKHFPSRPTRCNQEIF